MVFMISSTSCSKPVRFAGASEEGVGGGSMLKLNGGGVIGCRGIAYNVFVGVSWMGDLKTMGNSSSSSESSKQVSRGIRSELRGGGMDSGGGR